MRQARDAAWLPADPALPAPTTWTGDMRYLGRLRSAILGDARDVWVWLPPGYARGARRYPTIYFHDGQNIFDATTAFAGVEWQADETLERLVGAGTVRPAIAVAVANSPRRIAEYTPAADRREPQSGQAARYVRFLAQELVPRIDAAFRTLPDRAHRAIVGSSLGGLVSLYAGLAARETFGLVAGVSPLLDWADQYIERLYANAPRAHLPLRLWVDMGTAEDAVPTPAGETSPLVRDLRRFREVLLRAGYLEGATLGYEEDPGATHTESAWAARLPRILRFLLPPDPAA